MTVALCILATLCPTPRGGHAQAVPAHGGRAEVVVETPIDTGRRVARALGITGSEWRCLARIGSRESGWSVEKWNRGGSGAYGIGQALPASKMAAFGADYMTSASTQVRWMISYVRGRYGTPCAALSHSYAYGWY